MHISPDMAPCFPWGATRESGLWRYQSISINHELPFGLLTKFKFHYVAPQFFIFRRPNCTKFRSLKCAHISLWLNPMGHSKFHITSNHPPPATDSGRTARTHQCRWFPPYSLPPFFSYSWQRMVPVPVTGVRYNSLLWMCMLNTLTWPDL